LNKFKSVERNSPIPLKHQVIQSIKDLIIDGTYNPGDKLPSEDELCKLFDVSKITIRHAINDLVQQGILSKERPKGTFVSNKKVDFQFVNKFIGFAKELIQEGHDVESIVLESKITTDVSPRISKNLNISSGEKIFFLKRLRKVDGEKILIVDSYIPYKKCEGIEKFDFNRLFLMDVLSKEYGLDIVEATRTVEPVVVDSFYAEMLEVPEGSAAFFLTSKACLKDGSVIEYYETVMRGDKGNLLVTIKHD
jgi:GntR family transcriptional regulator